MAISSGRGPVHHGAREGEVVRRFLAVVAVIAFVLVVVVLSIRASRLMNEPGSPHYSEWALQDFRDAVYYPIVCFLNDGNPYDSDYYFAHFPVGQPFPPYSPMTFLVYLPFGLLPHSVSQNLFFVFTVLLTLVFSHLIIRVCGSRPTVAGVFGLSAAILASRPGHWNLMLGQTTLPLVIAAYAALFFSTKLPWASGIAVAVATLKPTFGIPLILVMLSLRHYRPVVVGILISGAATLVPSMVLVRSAGGVVPLLRSIWEGYTSLSNESAASITRVDAVALIGRLSGDSPGPLLELGIFILVIAVAGAVMHHVRSRATGQGADLYCIAVASIAILISVYQLSYSALLLVMPITALFLNRWVPVEFEVNPIVRVVLIVLLLIPMVNYAASYGVAGRFESGSPIWLAVTSVNSIGVLLAFCIYVVVGSMRVSKPPSPIGPKSPDMSLG